MSDPDPTAEAEDAVVLVSTPNGIRHYEIEEFIEEGGSATTLSLIARDQILLKSGRLPEYVDHNPGVVERAMEEEVFVGVAKFRGWMVAGDEDAPDHWRDANPGETLTGRFLMVDYSEKAWQLIAEESGGSAGRWYNYRWEFIPKSKSRVVTIRGIRDEDHADEIRARARNAEREIANRGWEESLEHATSDPTDLEG